MYLTKLNPMKRRLLNFIAVLPMLAVLFSSCAKEPTVGAISATIDGYSVSFTVAVTDADTYLWNFGDNQTSTEAEPVHTYVSSGTFTVNVTVSGKGGEATATKVIVITPSVLEMLSGGSTASNGKTWVLSTSYVNGMNGGSVVDNAMFVMLPTVENVLEVIGLGYEYDNEYTFYANGDYKVDVKNELAITAGIYGMVNAITKDVGNANNTLGIYAATFINPTGTKWTLHEENLVVKAVINPTGVDVPAPTEDRTITGKKWISLSGDAYFGILDFPTTRKFIIKEITPDKMEIALLVCGYFPDPTAWDVPSFLYHLTFVPKK